MNRAVTITRPHEVNGRVQALWFQCEPKNNYLHSRLVPKGSVSGWTLPQYYDQSIKATFKYPRLLGKRANPLCVASAGKTKFNGGRWKESY